MLLRSQAAACALQSYRRGRNSRAAACAMCATGRAPGCARPQQASRRHAPPAAQEEQPAAGADEMQRVSCCMAQALLCTGICGSRDGHHLHQGAASGLQQGYHL